MSVDFDYLKSLKESPRESQDSRSRRSSSRSTRRDSKASSYENEHGLVRMKDEYDVEINPGLYRGAIHDTDRWNSLPERFQPSESLHTPRHREKRFVPRAQKLNLMLCKNMKQVWRKKSLLIIELLVPNLVLCLVSIVMSAKELDKNPDPILYKPFAMEPVPLQVCNKLLISPKCQFTEDVVKGLEAQQKLYKLLETHTFKFHLTDKDIPKKDLESGTICANVHFHTSNTQLKERGYKFPEVVEYDIRLPAVQHKVGDDVKPELRQTNSLWETTHVRSARLNVGPRHRDDKYGGSPGYYSEGFLFIQRAVDYLILEMIYAQEKAKLHSDTELPIRYRAVDKIHPLLQRFPHPPFQNANFVQMVTEQLASFLVLTYLPIFVFNTWLLVKERQAGAKGHLSYYNISPWHCWLTWIVYKMIFYSVAILPTVAFIMIPWSDGRAIINLSSMSVIYFFIWSYTLNVLSMSCTISTWFSNATTASIMAATYWIASYYPIVFVERNIESFALWFKYFWCMSPNTGLMIGFQIIGLAEFNSDGIDWNTFFAEEFDLGHVMVIFMGSVVVRVILAVYFEHIFPSTNQFGFRVPWLYFIHIWWWRGELPKIKKDPSLKLGASELEKEHPELFEFAENDTGKKELTLSSVSKVIDGVKVLNCINLEFMEGEIFVILGTEKSGKSTLFKICTARMGTTSGVASLRKRDIRVNTRFTRTNIGYCTDTNFLYDYLTVEEHISLFVQLKGVLRIPDAIEEIDRLIYALDLQKIRKVRAEKLTYGQKRMVHIALAFGGGSKVVVLDEPTFQMTIPECRTAWRFIDIEKKRRCIVIFTKSAEEASFLGDRMAILANGEIQCKGTPSFIRACFGGGYILTILLNPNENGDKIIDEILETIPDMLMFETEEENTIIVSLPCECSPFFEKLFTDLEDKREELGIASMYLTYTLMNEVFNRISLHSAMQHVDKEYHRKSLLYSLTSQPDIVHMKDRDKRDPIICKIFHEFRLLLWKDIMFTKRRFLWHFLPIILTILIYVGLIMYTHYYRGFEEDLSKLPIDEIVQRVAKEIAPREPKCLFKCADYFSNHAAFCIQFRKILESYKLVVERASDSTSIQNQLLKSYNKTVTTQLTTFLLAVEVRFRAQDILVTVFFDNKMIHTPPLAVNILSNLLLSRMKSLPSGTNIVTNRISTTNNPLPYTSEDVLVLTRNHRCAGFFVGLATTWGCMVCAPNIIFNFIQEKKFKHLQIIAGVNLWLYWFSKLFWNFIFWIGVMTAGILCAILMTSKFVGYDTTESIIAVIVLCSFYGFAIVTLVGIMAFIPLFNQSSFHGYMYTSILCFLTGVLPMAIAYLISNPFNEKEHRGQPKGELQVLHHFFLLFPNYALGMGLFRIYSITRQLSECAKLDASIKNCKSKTPHDCCKEPNFHGYKHRGLLINYIYLGTEGLLGLIAIYFLETSLHKLSGYCERFFLRRKHKSKILPASEAIEDQLYLEATTMEADAADYQVFLRRLDKRHGETIMLNSLKIGIPYTQTFGLCGARGSGARTALQIIAGVLTPTSGDIIIDGTSLYWNRHDYLSKIGYCPREHMLSLEMTGQEILRLIGTIRGIRSSDLDELVINSAVRYMIFAEMTQLTKKYDAGNLRKLSAAVAMVGTPDLLIFEDPDMDLDPISREDMIKTIRTEFRGATTMIISSPTMEVCKTNCDRLGVLVDGTIRCIGPPDFLRGNFSGYSVVIQLIPEDPSFYVQGPILDADGNIPIKSDDEEEEEDHTTEESDEDRYDIQMGPEEVESPPRSRKNSDANPLTSVVVENPETPENGGPRGSIDSSADSAPSIDSMNPDDTFAPWELELYPVMEYFENLYPEAQIIDTGPCFIHYHLPDEISLASLFGTLEYARIEYDLETYRVSRGSLEQLLHNYTRGQLARLE